MGVIKVSHLKPDMLLGGDLKDRNGRLLVAAGTRLTERHIRIIKIWGIVEADIEGASEKDIVQQSDALIDPLINKAAEEAVAGHFRYSNMDDSAVSELFQISRRRKAERMVRVQSGLEKAAPHQPPVASRLPRQEDSGDEARQPEFQENPLAQIRKLIRTDVKLTTLPAIYTRINETIMKPNSSSHDIAELISKDTSLAARLLKVVNSAFYSYPSRIDSLSRAVSIVGTNQLSMLAFGIDVVNEFKHIPGDYINMDSFWRHSIACGIITRLIAATKNIQHTERLFVAGMLHDIGRLVVYHYTPYHATEILKRARDTQELLCRVEGAYLGADHSEIGGLLLKVWKLPQSLENAVRYHHTPSASQNSLEPAIVHVADVIAKALGVGSSGDHFVPPLDPLAWRQVGLSVNNLELIAEQTDRQLDETFQLFFK